MSSSAQDWSLSWAVEAGARTTAGGHGFVTRVFSLADGTHGALKQLHAEHVFNTERRQRFAKEIAALSLLGGEGVPKLLDENSKDLELTGSNLYFVADWVEGPTLTNYTNGKPTSLEEALTICAKLARIVQRCHDAGVVHRDIKPDNIIVRSAPEDIWLVDFGQSLIEIPNNSFETETGQELGNRFLRMPDLGAGEAKKDSRLDITFLVGILFFLLAGHKPDQIVDSENKKPHERTRAGFPSELLTDPRWRKVVSIFDVGFSLPVNLRFQSASAFLERITAVTEVDVIDHQDDLQIAIAQYRALRNSLNIQIDAIENSLCTELNALAQAIKPLCLEPAISAPAGRAEVSEPGRRANLTWIVNHANAEEPRVFVQLQAALIGETRNEFEIRLAVHPMAERGVQGNFQLYRGYAADPGSLEQQRSRIAQLALKHALGLLMKKIGTTPPLVA